MKAADSQADFRRFREQQDMRALARVFDATAPQLLAVARHLAGRRDDAEDLVQATFLTALERAPSWDPARALLPWLLGILALHAHKLRHARGKSVEADRLTQRALEQPDDSAARRELRAAVASAVAQLPTDYSGPLRRHLLDGFGPAQIAAEFGLSPGNARVRLHRGLKMLRQRLPSGFTGVAWMQGPAWLTLRSVRARVLAQASKLTGRAAPLSPAFLVVTAVVGAALLLPVFALRGPRGAAELAAVAPRAAPSEELATRDAPEPTAREQVAASAPPPAAPATAEARIRGRLLDDAGAPLAGAKVLATTAIAHRRLARGLGIDERALPGADTTSDSEGRFELRLATTPATRVSVRARVEGRASQVFSLGVIAAGSTHDLGTSAMAPAAKLRVMLRTRDGQPLGPHWRLELTEKADDPPGPRSVWSRRIDPERGEPIEVDDAPAGTLRVRATSGLLAGIAEQRVETRAGATVELELQYDGPDPSTSIAVDTSRSESIVRLPEPPPTAVTLVDANGERRAARSAQPSLGYRFDAVPPGKYRIEFDAPGYRKSFVADVEPGQTAQLELLGDASVKLVWQRGPAPERYGLRAARSSPDGRSSSSPLELTNASILAPPGGAFDAFPPGDWELTLEVPKERVRTFRVDRLGAGETRVVVVDALSDAVLRGTLRDLSGEPLADVPVLAARARAGSPRLRLEASPADGGQHLASGWSAEGGLERSVTAEVRLRTDAEGRFEARGLQPGEWIVGARWNSLLRSETVACKLADEPVELVLTAPPSGRIQGRVLNASAAVIGRLSLSIVDTSNPLASASVALKDDGSFELGPVAAGRYRAELAARVARRGQSALRSTAVFTGTEEGPRAGQREFHVAPGAVVRVELDAASIAPGEVRVTLTLDGEPAKDCEVELRSVRSGAGSLQFGKEADAQGVATLSAVPPGEYELEVFAANGTWSVVHGERVALTAGQERELRIALTLAKRTVRIVDASGNPLAFRRVTWRATGATREASASTRGDGEVALGMPLGPVTFTCPGAELVDATLEWKAGEDVIVLRAK